VRSNENSWRSLQDPGKLFIDRMRDRAGITEIFGHAPADLWQIPQLREI